MKAMMRMNSLYFQMRKGEPDIKHAIGSMFVAPQAGNAFPYHIASAQQKAFGASTFSVYQKDDDTSYRVEFDLEHDEYRYMYEVSGDVHLVLQYEGVSQLRHIIFYWHGGELEEMSEVRLRSDTGCPPVAAAACVD